VSRLPQFTLITSQSILYNIFLVFQISQGFGFVEMPNSREGQMAISNLNNQIVGGNRIRVKMAEEKGGNRR